MTTQPTQNPVPSESPRDLKYNAGKIDEFVTSLAMQYIDRLGQAHYTIEGISALAKQAINQLGWVPFGTFQDGATLTSPNQILKDTASGEYYRWDGALPKDFPAGSTPSSSGGIDVGAWVSVGDGALRTMLASSAGATGIGTNHRGNLALDLNALDRRPDGYAGGITDILANGKDVDIASDVTITAPLLPANRQHIKGSGGVLKQKTSTAAGIRIESSDANNTVDSVTVSNLRTTGSTLSAEPGNEGYAVFLRNTKYTKILGIHADRYTGAIAAGTSKSLIIRDVLAHDTTFHPLNSSTRDGRGGYGVITDNITDSLIDGVILDAKGLDDGRHILYLSTGGYSNTTGNSNFIARGLIGRYADKDDRNFWGVNVRKSEIFILDGICMSGANGGLAFNVENGNIADFIATNIMLDIIKYQDGVGVYGVSMPKGTTYLGARFLLSNFNIRIRPKTTSLTGADCVAVSLDYQNGMVTNGVTNVPAAGLPILINDSATNTTISNIHDNILPGYTGATAAMITFGGSAVSNITVKNITTSRPMFARLAVVTDLTVDFQRKARVSTSGSGGSSKIDPNEIISTISLASSAVTVNFPTHVTQNAVENVQVAGTAGVYQAFVTSIGAKSITVALYTPSGVLINPTTAGVSFNVILLS